MQDQVHEELDVIGAEWDEEDLPTSVGDYFEHQFVKFLEKEQDKEARERAIFVYILPPPDRLLMRQVPVLVVVVIGYCCYRDARKVGGYKWLGQRQELFKDMLRMHLSV